MNRISSRLSLRIILALAAIWSLAAVAAAQDPACPLGGYINADTGNCAVGVEIDIAYPAWLTESEAAQTATGELLNTVRDEFMTTMSTPLEEFYTGGFLDVSYLEFEHGAPLRSVVFLISTYTGGAHPNSYYLSVTVDTLANRVLALDGDIFVPGADVMSVLQPLVVAELVAQQGEDADLEWIDSGTDELTDYLAWAINAGTLELFFPPYQVAAYAMGSFQVSIPVDNLAGVINPMLLP